MEVKKRAKNVLKMLGCVLLVVIVILAGSIAYLMLGKSVDGASSEPTPGDEGTRSLVVYFSRSDVIETDEDTDATTSASLNKVDVDLRQYFGQKKSKDYAAFFSSSSSFCCGVK